ncbi:MAG TPA: glycosyltransferase family 4 protein [Albitalea sp.]|uniref:glycosyltransferase family 4 protein n=1 Tax=Piscinibacter sp. TaxID=1903157 RepID=UPI002ED58C87
MHVGLFSPSWPVFRYPNGIVIYVHHLREELLRQGHRVSVFTCRSAPGLSEPGIHVVKATMGFRLQRRLAALAGSEPQVPLGWGRLIAARIAEVHATDPIDVIEMEETFGWCADVHRLQPVPLVVKLHGPACLTLFGEDRAAGQARRRIAAEGRGLRSVPVIVSPSRNTLQQTIAHYGLAPALTAVVPNPVSIDQAFEPWDAQRCDPKTLLFVGRFDTLKGGDIMLLAFARLLEHEPEARLVFVGPDGGISAGSGPRVPFEAFCAQHLSAAQRERIDYRGPLPRERTFALRTQAAVTVIASRFDNQPNTALEAMIQAAPVVAVDAGGVGELIEHGVSGRLARAGDIDDLCRQLRAMLADLPAAARMGQAAREFVLQRHSLPGLTSQALDLYRRAIAQHADGRLAA